ncbi:uncharacterized protein LOC141602259 [Silene latifolia]|uniref:uncharacterized protein LOC141602259 n=1 Tax=Silene latifolia TaxID=37657 RepID=UPI003D774142
MEEATPKNYADSPFIDEIAIVDLPKKFVIPSIRTYDGTSDPHNHVAFYKQKILVASIPSEFRQVCMCKGFGTTLTSPALQWYINLPNGSIKSFVDLVNTFNQQFASSRELEKRSSDLYRITQIKDESLRSFLARFNKEKVSIPRCDIGTVMEAFRQGLLPNNDLYVELTKLEEDKSYKVGGTCNTKDYDKPNRKSGGRSNNYMSSPYTRPDLSEVNLTQEQQGLIKRVDNMGAVVRWPRKLDNLNPRKDHTKCGRIEDPSINIQEQKQECNLPPPPPLYEVKFINGGSEICGLTSSAAKKIATTPQTKSPCKPDNIPPITFSNCDLVGVPNIHHDGLVIAMQIGTANVRRILVDGGSSVNLIMLDVLKAMKIKEDQITMKSSVLVGFSGETKNTVGQIYFPTYTEGVASYERFGVLDYLPCYNVILGKPWIHNVKAVPSTYH